MVVPELFDNRAGRVHVPNPRDILRLERVCVSERQKERDRDRERERARARARERERERERERARARERERERREKERERERGRYPGPQRSSTTMSPTCNSKSLIAFFIFVCCRRSSANKEFSQPPIFSVNHRIQPTPEFSQPPQAGPFVRHHSE